MASNQDANSHRSVLVAGGTGALGSAVVEELLNRGWAVTTTWLVESERDQLVERLGEHSGLNTVNADLADPDGAQTAVGAVASLGGVVNLVGGFAAGTLVHETSPQQFEHMLQLNLRPAFLLARNAIPKLVDSGGGAFICVSARAALRPFAGASAYVTAKSALLGFVGALDADYGSQRVRANAIVPDIIDTAANRSALPDADHSRWPSPADVAKVVAFLVSDDSDCVTGGAVPVYGRR